MAKVRVMINRNIILGAIPILALLSTTASAFAVPSPNGPGQPRVECGEDGLGDGPHGFSTSGFARAESVYAGSDGSQSHHSNNDKAVSQYDVACLQLTR